MITEGLPKGKDSKAVTAIEKAIKTNKDLIAKLGGDVPKTEIVEEKKATKQQKKKYKIIPLKVASILAIIGLGALWATCIYIPNFYETIASIIESINPFNYFEGTSDLEHYVNNINK